MPANLLERPDIARHVLHKHICGLFAAGYFDWPLDVVIRQLKFGRRVGCAPILATWFAAHARVNTHPLPELLLPVPVPLSRLASRHFNQAERIATAIGAIVGVNVKRDWAIRRRGKAQHSLGRQARLKNLQHAYQVHSVGEARHVAIVDDVVTTGATINTLAGLLKQQNPALQIDVWAIAVTPANAGATAR